MRGRAWALRRSARVYTRVGSRAGGRTLWRRSAMTRRSSPERRSSTMRRSSPLRRSTATSTTCCRRSLLRRRSSARRSLPLRRPAPIRPPSQNLSRSSPRTRQLRKTYAFGWLSLGRASSRGFRHLPPWSSITPRVRHGHPATGDVTERQQAAYPAPPSRPARSLRCTAGRAGSLVEPLALTNALTPSGRERRPPCCSVSAERSVAMVEAIVEIQRQRSSSNPRAYRERYSSVFQLCPVAPLPQHRVC